MAKNELPSPKSRFKHAPHVAWRRVEEEAVLLNVDSSDYYSLDPVAADIWERLGKGDTLQKAAARISKDYAVSEEKAAKDARSFVRDLVAEKLLRPAD